MKLLVVCSSLDLDTPLSATPAWWQLLKGLYESGVDLVVTTYHGPAISTPWWRAYPNPTRLEGQLVAGARRLVGRRRTAAAVAVKSAGETPRQKAERIVARSVVGPQWRRHLARVLDR